MELFKLFGTIAVDNTEANSAIDETTNKAKEADNETSSAFKKIGSVVGTAAVGIGTAGLAIGGAFIAAVEGTREYRQQMGLLESAFETAGHSTEAARDTYSELNAVIGDSEASVEAAQHIALLTDNEKEMQQWTDICTGVYAKFGASLPIEGLTEAANHTAKVGEVQGSLADALEWSGISVDSFNKELAKCSSEQERQDLITKTLNETYKDSATQYQETNKDIMESQKAQERLTNAMAEVGRVGEPIMTALRNGAASLAEHLAPAIESIIEKIKDATIWVKENEQTVKMWTGIIIGASVAIGTFLLIMNWGAIMGAASKAIGTVRLAVIAFNTALLANPIGLIVAAIAGLVAAFIYLWNNVDGFREFWIKTWDTIKKTASDAWNSITKWFSDAWKKCEKAWAGCKKFFSDQYEGIKKVFSNIGSWFSEKFNQAWSNAKKAFSSVKQFFTQKFSDIKSAFSSVGSWFKTTFDKAWTNIKKAFSNWGSFFGGLWDSIKKKFGSIGTTLGTSMSNAVKNGMNKIIGTIESTINKGIRLINKAINLANKIPGIDVGTVNELTLPRLSKGGILERGQIGFLEGSGTEAVVPLENNKAWISKVANDMTDAQGNKDKTNEIISRIDSLISLVEKMVGMKIYMDSGVLVGEITPAINEKLGDIYKHGYRGNTR